MPRIEQAILVLFLLTVFFAWPSVLALRALLRDEWLSRRLVRYFHFAVPVALACLIAFPVFRYRLPLRGLAGYRPLSLIKTMVAHWRRADEWRLLATSPLGVYRTLDYVRRQTPPGAHFLVFRQSDFAFYAERRFTDHNDHDLIPVYRAASKEETHRLLIERGIDYLYVPNYAEPTIYRTRLAEMMADPKYCRLEFAAGGYRLFRLLRQPDASVRVTPLRIANGNFSDTSRSTGFATGWSIYGSSDKAENSRYWVRHSSLQPGSIRVRNPRREEVILYTGRGMYDDPPDFAADVNRILLQAATGDPQRTGLELAAADDPSVHSETLFDSLRRIAGTPATIEQGGCYLLGARLRGEGPVAIYLLQYSDDGKFTKTAVFDGELRETARLLAGQILLRNDTIAFRIAIGLKDTGWIQIEEIGCGKVQTQ